MFKMTHFKRVKGIVVMWHDNDIGIVYQNPDMNNVLKCKNDDQSKSCCSKQEDLCQPPGNFKISSGRVWRHLTFLKSNLFKVVSYFAEKFDGLLYSFSAAPKN